MMRISKVFIITISLMIVFMEIGAAQYKAQVEDKPTIQEAIRYPGNASKVSGLDWFNSKRFNMQQSYSLSMGFGNGRTSSMGLYMNNMSYLLAENLKINARFGFMHDPLSMNNTVDGNVSQNLIYGADVLYKPSENSKIRVSFQKQPYYSGRSYYNDYYNSGFYNWR